jgi:hypothetical protein
MFRDQYKSPDGNRQNGHKRLRELVGASAAGSFIEYFTALGLNISLFKDFPSPVLGVGALVGVAIVLLRNRGQGGPAAVEATLIVPREQLLPESNKTTDRK